jgi:hypothetical protein
MFERITQCLGIQISCHTPKAILFSSNIHTDIHIFNSLTRPEDTSALQRYAA